MVRPGSGEADGPPGAPRRFATTRWSLVAAAGRPGGEGDAGRALEELCHAYWYPLYDHARRRGYSPDDARDRTQGFFARLLEKRDLGGADRSRGRFRSYLLGAFRHYLANERDRDRAGRRGGGRAVLSLDFDSGETRFLQEPSSGETPERAFDRRWALTVLERAMARLRDDYERGGKGALFAALRPALAGDRGVAHAEVAARLGMTEGAVKVAVHRLRSRCADLVRREIAETVGSPEEVEDELGHLFRALSS